jgi:SAM-dependent methyltransferase
VIDNRRYYRKHAQKFFERTAFLDVEKLYAPFLRLLPEGAHILDAGCGSGRDTKAFRERGYQVTAFDATPEMVELATQLTGEPVAVMRFQEMAYVEEFDGIWACASLLHVTLAELSAVFARFIEALKPGGYWYMSFKYGGEEGRERQSGERLFTDFTEVSLQTFLEGFEQLKIVTLFATGDERYVATSGERWVTAVVQKVTPG